MSNLPYPLDEGGTHYDGCWRARGHHNCAVTLLAEARRLLGSCAMLLEQAADTIHLACGVRTTIGEEKLRKHVAAARAFLARTAESDDAHRKQGETK